MVAYVTNIAGARWDVPTHFTPEGTPVKGDTIEVPNEDWTLTVAGSRDIGVSDAQLGTNAINIAGRAGQLIFEEDCFLRYRGEIRNAGGISGKDAKIVLAPGVTIWHDSTEANDPTNQNYSIYPNMVQNTVGYIDYSACTNPSKRVTIGSETGGGRGRFYTPFQYGGGILCPAGAGYVDHIRWGGAATDHYAYRVNFGSTYLQLRHATFTDCGGFIVGSPASGLQIHLEMINFNTSVGSSYDLFISSGATHPIGTVKDCVFRRNVQVTDPHIDVDNCLFPGNTGFTKSVNSFTNCANINTVGGNGKTNMPNAVSYARLEHHNDNTPSGIRGSNTPGTIDKYLYLQLGTGAPGYAVWCDANYNVIAITNCISNVRLCSTDGAANEATSFSKCTASGFGIRLNRANDGATGQLAAMTDCLIYDGGAAGYKISDNKGVAENPIVPANANHNGGHDLAAGSNLNGYNGMNLNPPGAIGANDVDADPEFKIRYTFQDWDAENGGDGTIDHGIAQMRVWNTPTGNPAYSPYNLLDKFFSDNDNWAPTNEAYNGTGTAGGTIGAKNWKQAEAPPEVPKSATPPFGGTISAFG